MLTGQEQGARAGVRHGRQRGGQGNGFQRAGGDTLATVVTGVGVEAQAVRVQLPGVVRAGIDAGAATRVGDTLVGASFGVNGQLRHGFFSAHAGNTGSRIVAGAGTAVEGAARSDGG